MAKQKGFIGVDIGTHTIKMAQVEKRSGRIELTDAALIARETPWSVNGWQKADPLDSANELKSAYSIGRQFQGRKVATAASMALCDVRSLNIRLGSRHQNLDAIRKGFRNIERMDIENRQFDYWPIPADWKSRSQDNVYVLSMDNQWAEQLAGDHLQAGLNCQLIDGTPNALARAAEMQTDGECTAILDWGYTRATFCVQRAGTPVFVRMLRESGLRVAIETLSDAMSVSADEASRLLQDFGLPGHDEPATEVQAMIAATLAPLINQITAELTRTVDHLQRSSGAVIPDSMFLFGGGSAIRNVRDRLTEKIPFQLRSWSLPVPRENFRWPIELFGPAAALSSLAWSL